MSDQTKMATRRRLPLRALFYAVMFVVSTVAYSVTGRWGFIAAALGFQFCMILAAWRHEHYGSADEA